MNFWEFILDQKVELANQIVEHIGLTSASLAIAILLGVTVGILLTRYSRVSEQVIGTVGIIQTIPTAALALLLDGLLGILQQKVTRWLKPILVGSLIFLVLFLSWLIIPNFFNNSYALMMRNEDIESLGINSISELKDYLSDVATN